MCFSLGRSNTRGFERGKLGPEDLGVSKGLEREEEKRRTHHLFLGLSFCMDKLWKFLARVGVEEPALAQAERKGRRGGGVLRLPLPGSSSAPWRVERSALENTGCPGPLPLLVPYSLSSHLATACTGTLFFMAKASPS